MDEALRQLVRQRAADRCEYCRLPAEYTDAPFQVDHVIAEKHHGPTVEENLAWSCFYCNSFKGPNIAGRDEQTGAIMRLFHPRSDVWSEHFQWAGPVLIALTDVGRATIDVLRINDPDALEFRRLLLELKGDANDD